MGNTVLTCYKGRAKVTVILADGEVEEYVRPVRVTTVLQRHPKHVLVKVAIESGCRRAQQRRKVTLMRPEQTLKCKRQYLVLPMQSGSGRMADCWALASTVLQSSARRTKRKRYKEKKHMAKLFSAHSKCNSSALNHQDYHESTASLLDSNSKLQDHNLSAIHPAGTGKSHGFGGGLSISNPWHKDFEWRPSLDSIPEMPWPLVSLHGSPTDDL